MPVRSDYRLQREGITFDTLGRLIKNTALNPFLNLPLILLARYHHRSRLHAFHHPRLHAALKKLLYLGLLQRFSGFLDRAVSNNWSNDVYDWSKELVVVTGGSEGIGAVVVRLLAERMIRVVVLDVQDLKYEAPQGVHHYTCDLASPLSISSTAAQIRAEHGDPTILINNAGLSRGKPILSASESDIRLTFNVNTLSHYLLAQAFLPAMVARNHGMIVTVASLAAYVTAPRFVDYSASKAAAVAFHEGLGAELATLYGAPKVRTVLVCQGYARTPLSAGLDEGDGWWMYALRPETVAEEIVKTVLGGRSRHVVLPASAWYAAAQLRGWPVWVQVGLRKTIARRTKGYRGRQVEQPSEGKIGGGLA